MFPASHSRRYRDTGSAVALMLLILGPALSGCAVSRFNLFGGDNEVQDLPNGGAKTQLSQLLTDSDRQVAFDALNIALNEAGDGTTIVWRNPETGVKGTVTPSSAFHGPGGLVCRQLVYAVALGENVRRIDGTACRGNDGRWELTS